MDANQIIEEREKTHGSYEVHARTTQWMKDVIRDYMGSEKWTYLDNRHREALDMICHKIGRIVAGDPNHRDHWDDIAGYATLASKACKP
jgi:hypothetical protein